MKVLVLNGSPKAERSDTLHIARAFCDGMKSAADVEVKEIHVIKKRIEYCTGCFVCKKNGGTCVIRDDMAEILDEIKSSDVIIYSFPLYSYGMPAPLKNVIDRLMPLSSWAMVREENGKYGHTMHKGLDSLRYVMLCGCGFPNSKHNFEAAVRQFELKFPRNRTIITVPESPMFNIPQADELTKPRLELIKQAGAQYAANGEIEAELMQAVTSPMLPDQIYAQFAINF